MERMITVTGVGSYKVSPDTVILNIILCGIEQDYDAAVEKSQEELSVLTECIKSFGFERKALKTSDYRVFANIEKSFDNGYEERRKNGYAYSSSHKLEFPKDNKRMSELLFALSKLEIEPSISIDYTISDPNSYLDTLLGNAVRDARRKAEILASASGVTLGDIISLDYGKDDLRLYGRSPMENCLLSTSSCHEIDIEPENIENTETVRVIYSIR